MLLEGMVGTDRDGDRVVRAGQSLSEGTLIILRWPPVGPFFSFRHSGSPAVGGPTAPQACGGGPGILPTGPGCVAAGHIAEEGGLGWGEVLRSQGLSGVDS